MRYYDNHNNNVYHERQYENEHNRFCCGHKHSNKDHYKHDYCEKCGKVTYNNGSPIINVYVNGIKQGCGGEEPTHEQFLSCYMEALGNEQIVPRNGNIVFDEESIDNVGNYIELNSSGTIFTINRTGLYHVEWDINLAPNTTGAVVGIIENGEPASGSSSSNGGNHSSGTIIHVETVPFTLSLRNYNTDIVLENNAPYENSAASIRIVRFADGPIE